MSGLPQFRANWSKQALRYVRHLTPASRDAIVREIGDDTIREINTAGILAFLPAQHHARIFDAVVKVLGPTEAVRFWRDSMVTNMEQPLLRPLVQGGLRLFGATPYSIIRMSPRAWSLVARDCGTHVVVHGEGPVAVRMDFVDVPRLLAKPGFIAHCLGNCDAVLRFLRLRGVSAPVEERLGSGRFSIEVSNVHAESVLDSNASV